MSHLLQETPTSLSRMLSWLCPPLTPWGALGTAPSHPCPTHTAALADPEKCSWLTPLVCGEGLSLPLPVSDPPHLPHMVWGAGGGPSRVFYYYRFMFLVIGFFV